MIQPFFDTPRQADLPCYWRSCPHADMHLLVLEVLQASAANHS